MATLWEAPCPARRKRGARHPALLDNGTEGVVQSRLFAGLWPRRESLRAGEAVRVMATLREGLASPEHAALLAALPQRRGSSPLIVTALTQILSSHSR